MRIATYKQVNIILGSSLNPDDRCIDKTTAIANGASTEPLEQFEYNRLIPVEYIQSGSTPATYYTVSFVDYDGTTVLKAAQSYAAGRSLGAPIPTRTGYTFTGWSSNTGNAYTGYAFEDVVYTAQYTINKYTIRFLDSKNSNAVIDTHQFDYGTTASTLSTYASGLTIPTYSGFTFSNWTPTFETVTANKDYTTVYTQDQVTLTFMSDGTQYHQDSYTPGAPLTSPGTPTKTGADAADYDFGGWEDQMGNNMPSTVPSSNTIYYARWINRYTKVTGLFHGIYDSAEEGEPVSKITLPFKVHPCTLSQARARQASVTGPDNLTLYISGYKYVNTENDAYNKTYTQDPNPTSFSGSITITNWGYTAQSPNAGENHCLGGRYTITFSSELNTLGWTLDDYLSSGDAAYLKTTNQDGSVSYLVRSRGGAALDTDATDMLEPYYPQVLYICVNKTNVNAGTYYMFDVKISPKYTAEKGKSNSNDTNPISNSQMAGLSGHRELFINLATNV